MEIELKQKAEQNLSDYIKQAWTVIEPGREYMHNWHIDAICEYLEAVKAGQITRLIINQPPRSMKSISVTVMFPTWMWIDWPESRWLFASYSASLSTKHSLDRRTIMQSEWYQTRWGDRFAFAGDQNLKTEYSNDKRGTMIATSVGGTATGKGGDFVIVDDLHNPEGAESDTERETAIRFFDQTLSTRLDDKKAGVIIVVMQRLHEKDLTGHLLAEIGGYEHLKLQGIANAKTVIHFPVSGKEIIREQDHIMWPEREDEKAHEAAKKALGTYGYSCQYDQDPSPKEGGILKRKWWKFYKQAPMFDEIILSWDCAFKDEEQSKTGKVDPVCGQAWGRKGGDFYLLDQVLGPMDFPTTLKAVTTFSAKWPLAFAKLVESKANGPGVVAMLKSKISGLVEIEPEGGKVARANAVAPLAEAGNVYLPDPLIASWIHDFIEECAKFPKAAHDDQVDAMTQAIIYLYKRAMQAIKTYAQKPKGW